MIFTNILAATGIIIGAVNALPTCTPSEPTPSTYFALVLPGGRRIAGNNAFERALIAGPGGEGQGLQFFIRDDNVYIPAVDRLPNRMGTNTVTGDDKAVMVRGDGNILSCNLSNPAGNNGALTCYRSGVKQWPVLCNNVNLYWYNKRDKPGCAAVDLQAVKY